VGYQLHRRAGKTKKMSNLAKELSQNPGSFYKAIHWGVMHSGHSGEIRRTSGAA